MKRRRFLMLTGIGIGSCLIPSSLYFVAPGIREYALLILKEELSYLRLEPKGLTKYVNDYFNATGNDVLSTIKWKTLYYLKSDWRTSERIAELVKYYLLSSDFFIHKTDETREVHYLGLFNSYKSPVPNPYSFVLYPPSEIKEP